MGLARNDSQRGITLIELLVVVVILAFGAGVVVWNAPPSRPAAKEEAERFAARLAASADEAVMGGGDFRLEVGAGGYVISRRSEGEWRFVHRASMPTRPELVEFRVDVADAAADNALALNGVRPDEAERTRNGREDVVIVPIDPLGLAPAFAATFASRRGVWRVIAAEDGRISVRRD